MTGGRGKLGGLHPGGGALTTVKSVSGASAPSGWQSGSASVGLSAADNVTVLVDTTAPVIAYTGNAGSYTVDQMVNITCTRSDAMSGVDPATDACVDINGSALDFGVGVHTVTSSVADNASNVGHGSVTFEVIVTHASLGNLTEQYVSQPGVASALTKQLDSALKAGTKSKAGTGENVLQAYIKAVSAQSDKALSEADAATLIRLAEELMGQ